MKKQILSEQEELMLSTAEFETHLSDFQQDNSVTIPAILCIAKPKSMDEYDEVINNRIIEMQPYGNPKMVAFSFYKSISMSIQDDNQ